MVEVGYMVASSLGCIDGIELNRFVVGRQYEVGNSIGAVFLAERWATPVEAEPPAMLNPIDEGEPDGAKNLSRDVSKETYPPYLNDLPVVAADARRKSRRRRF
jgi:hypothetical protein